MTLQYHGIHITLLFLDPLYGRRVHNHDFVPLSVVLVDIAIFFLEEVFDPVGYAHLFVALIFFIILLRRTEDLRLQL